MPSKYLRIYIPLHSSVKLRRITEMPKNKSPVSSLKGNSTPQLR